MKALFHQRQLPHGKHHAFLSFNFLYPPYLLLSLFAITDLSLISDNFIGTKVNTFETC